VHRQRTIAKGQVVVHEVETSHSRRRIALDSQTLAALRQHRVGPLAERLAADVAWQDTGADFIAPDGRELHPKSVSNGFTEHARTSGLATIRLHDFSHSYATAALSSGEPSRSCHDVSVTGP
jgi:integrase